MRTASTLFTPFLSPELRSFLVSATVRTAIVFGQRHRELWLGPNPEVYGQTNAFWFSWQPQKRTTKKWNYCSRAVPGKSFRSVALTARTAAMGTRMYVSMAASGQLVSCNWPFSNLPKHTFWYQFTKLHLVHSLPSSSHGHWERLSTQTTKLSYG